MRISSFPFILTSILAVCGVSVAAMATSNVAAPPALLAQVKAVASQAAPLPPARWQQALTLFGSPKYKPWFRHFEYANPNAPKGGKLRLMHPATFDSLNLYILKGMKAPAVNMIYDSLMTAAMDEPQTYYPLIAEAFRLDPKPEHEWIEFRLNAKAKWHDGVPITAEDVVWSLETLLTEGDPIYRLSYAPLGKATIVAPRVVRFTFSQPLHREAPILAAGLPILPKHYYQNVTFNKTTLTPPLGSGAYRVKTVNPGRSITVERVADYWGKDLPVNRGRNNFDSIRYDVYRDSTVGLEAFKAGEYDLRQENISRSWATGYNVPAVADGRIIKVNIPNKIPQGMQGFFYNLRRPVFADRRVREAIALTMDFEWVNKTLFYGAYKRNQSFFQFTPFAATEQLPGPKERALLEPYADLLPPQMMELPFTLPTTDGSGQNRKNLLRAQALLDAAGIPLVDGKRINPYTKEPLKVEFLLNQMTMQRVILPMRKGLKQLGIDGTLRIVDDAQYQRRLETFDYDIITGWLNLGVFFPGVEQMNSWHSLQADIEGSNNLSGLKNPVVDNLLERISKAHRLEELTPAARALDRMLLWEHVSIPHWYNSTFRTAYWNKFGKPAFDPPYGFAIDYWWMKDAEKKQ
jgi:microcin C transport system substrate-binding protein